MIIIKSVRTRVALGLGTNAGDSRHALQQALHLLTAGGLQPQRLAPGYRTRPVDCVPGTPDFINTALVAFWQGTPYELLALCKATEQALGRPAKHSRREARTIDLDILLFGQRRLNTVRLVVPHPQLLHRRFAIQPLAAIAPLWRLPGTGVTVASALAALPPAAPGDCEMLPTGYITLPS